VTHEPRSSGKPDRLHLHRNYHVRNSSGDGMNAWPRMADLEGTKAQRDQAEIAREMALEGMRGLGFESCCDLFAEHVLGRPDAEPDAVIAFGDHLGRAGWMERRIMARSEHKWRAG